MADAPLILHVSLQDERLTMKFAASATVAPQSQLEVRMDLVRRMNAELTTLMKSGLPTMRHPTDLPYDDGVYHKLQGLGEQLFAQCFPPQVRERLRQAEATDLVLRLDDHAVQVPWELAFDGHDFLLHKFRIGRQVDTFLLDTPRQHAAPHDLHRPLTMLIMAASTEDLPAPEVEAAQLYEVLTACPALQVEVMAADELDLLVVLQALHTYDLVHYAGHAHFNAEHPSRSGWLLPDGTILTAAEIRNIQRPPLLVFSNACQAGVTTAWEAGQAFGIGSAFLLAGTQNYLGTFGVIPDASSVDFAVDFYRQLVDSASIGEALAFARQQAWQQSAQHGLLWASYMHYGDPTWHLPVRDAPQTARVTPSIPRPPAIPLPQLSVEPSRQNEAQADQRLPQWVNTLHTLWRRRGRRRDAVAQWCWLLGIGIVLSLIGLWTVFPSAAPLLSKALHAVQQGDISRAETLFQALYHQGAPRVRQQAVMGLIVVALMRGDVPQALARANEGEQLHPTSGIPDLLRGLTFMHHNRPQEAIAAYTQATTQPQTLPCQRALAYTYLGRLHAAQPETQAQAVTYYDQAIQQCQALAMVYADKGAFLAQRGKYDEARGLYQRALQLRPEDSLSTVLLEELERRQQLAHDTAQQQRLKELLKELEAAYTSHASDPVDDPWTSRPLTLVVAPFHQKHAPGARGGTALGVEKRLWGVFQQGGRPLVVERERLDVLLQESRLCVAGLCDAATAPRLGRLAGGRLVALGELIHFASGEELSVRVTDTETGIITAMAVVTQPLEQVEQLYQALIYKIRRHYPLQGLILQVTSEDQVIVNLGVKHGMTVGLLLDVFDDNAPQNSQGKLLESFRTPIGQLQVIDVEQDLALTYKVHPIPMQAGWQVKEHQERRQQ